MFVLMACTVYAFSHYEFLVYGNLFTQQWVSDGLAIIFLCPPRCGSFPAIQLMCFVTGDSDTLLPHVVTSFNLRIQRRNTATRHADKTILFIFMEIYLKYFDKCWSWLKFVLWPCLASPCPAFWVLQQYAHYIRFNKASTQFSLTHLKWSENWGRKMHSSLERPDKSK